MEWLTRPIPEDVVPTIDRIIKILAGIKNDDGNRRPGIKSWAHPVGALKDLLKRGAT